MTTAICIPADLTKPTTTLTAAEAKKLVTGQTRPFLADKVPHLWIGHPKADTNTPELPYNWRATVLSKALNADFVASYEANIKSADTDPVFQVQFCAALIYDGTMQSGHLEVSAFKGDIVLCDRNFGQLDEQLVQLVQAACAHPDLLATLDGFNTAIDVGRVTA